MTNRRRPITLLVAAAVLAAVAGCSVRPAAGSAAAPVTPTTTTTTAVAFSGDLKDLLVPAPANSRPFEQPFSPDGRLTKQQIIDWYGGGPKAEDALGEYEFQQSVMEQWQLPDGQRISILLFQLPQPASARHLVLQTESAFLIPDYTDDSPISGIDESFLYIAKADDSTGRFDVQGFAFKKDLAMFVELQVPPPVNRGDATRLMNSQYARLP